ncbi:MAG: rod shape-determining protein MreC [Candidatus Calescibacterium sp.]|nr:hypothetical protein [Candidatus Calescibacterium sp.]MDW8133354.1 rod shape-determining protein MreC [Candidatus Calescibacterium sp.]
MSRTRIYLLLSIFFIYELIAMKYNLYSISLNLLSLINMKNNIENREYEYGNIVKSIIYNNPFYNSEIIKHLYSIEIIGISDVISYSSEYFYISTINGMKTLDIVTNESNFLGIVENVSPKISRIRYINSNSFQIPAKVIYQHNEKLGFIKTSSKIYFYPLKQGNQIEIYSQVKTLGYFHIPSGIIIGLIYNNNEVKLFKDIQNTNQVIVLRRKR